MSDHVVVDKKHAIKLPDSMPLDIGGMLDWIAMEPLANTNSIGGASFRCMACSQPQSP